MLPRECCQSVSQGCATLLLHTSRQCSHQGGQRGGEGQLNSPPTELLLQPVNPPRTAEGSRPGDGVSEAGQSVTPDVNEGQQPMSPQIPPREPLNLNQATVQGPGAPTRLCWPPSTTAAGRGRTLSMVSRSITSIIFKAPSRMPCGCGSGNSSLTASP